MNYLSRVSDASNRDLIKMQANGDIIWHVSNQQGEISAINLDDNGVYLLSVMVIMKSILMMEY
ncbi:hypothetical protein ACU5B6_06085 [Moritella viscosa]|uniref:hypothetical protein n=1 Tax=Moritella viscosa TaxID=80854 RepID=UPI00406C09C3